MNTPAFFILLSLCWHCCDAGTKQQTQTFATMPSHQTAVVGSTVVLPCRVLNFHGSVQWTKDGFGLGTTRDLDGFDRYSMIGSYEEGDFSLKIENANLDDDADYQCQVSSFKEVPIRSEVAHLTIYVPPSYPKIEYMPVATAGVPYIVACATNGARPEPEMQWMDNKGSVITKGTRYFRRTTPDGKLTDTNFTYTFTPTRHDNGRVITCLVHSPALTTALSASAFLRVEYPPHVQLVFSPGNLTEGSEAFATCQVDANPNNVTYRWFHEGKEVLGVVGDRMPLGVLSRSNQSATIACEVTNSVGTARTTEKLNVLYPPMFLAEPSSVSEEPGNKVTMKCNVDANPEPEIYWTKSDDHQVVGYGAEVQVRASKKTAGLYICTARSEGFEPLKGQVQLRLRGPPLIKAQPLLVVREGQNAVLRCGVLSVPHPVSLTWGRGGVSFGADHGWEVKEEQRADGVVSTLTIHNVSKDDFAAYDCTAINEYGVDSQQIILQRPPVIPFLLIVGVGGGTILVVIFIIFFILCGRRLSDRKEKVTEAVEKGAYTNGIGAKPHSGTDTSSIELGKTQVMSNLIPADTRSTGKDSDNKDGGPRTNSSLSEGERESDSGWERDSTNDSGKRDLTPTLTRGHYAPAPTVYPPPDDDYMPYVDYARDYLRIAVSQTESCGHFQVVGGGGGGGGGGVVGGSPFPRYSPPGEQPSSLPSSVAPPAYTLQPQPTEMNGDFNTSSPPLLVNGSSANVGLKHPQESKKELKGGVSHALNSGALQSKYIIPPQTKIKPGTLV